MADRILRILVGREVLWVRGILVGKVLVNWRILLIVHRVLRMPGILHGRTEGASLTLVALVVHDGMGSVLCIESKGKGMRVMRKE